LHSKDGSKYKGNNSYVNKVASHLNKLRTDDGVLKDRLSTLETSKQKLTIQSTQFKNEGNSNSPLSKSDDEKGIPTGSTTKYNPDNEQTATDNKRSPEASLAHELLGHGYDSDQGTTDYSETENGIPRSHQALTFILTALGGGCTAVRLFFKASPWCK